jgi:hypothetical protein
MIVTFYSKDILNHIQYQCVLDHIVTQQSSQVIVTLLSEG